MDLRTIERLIDEAIEKEDYEKVLRLLDEREKILKSANLTREELEEILKRDEERMKRIKEKKEELIGAIKKSRNYEKSLKAYKESFGEQEKRSWGKG